MNKLDSLERLTTWEEYRLYSKACLKQLDGESPCFVSKDKVRFDLGGQAWAGHAFLVGRTAPRAAKALKKEGVLFKEGVVRPEGKVLHVAGLPEKLVLGARRALIKLRLGHELVAASGASGASGASDEPAEAGGMGPEVRRRKVVELKKLGADLDRVLAALSGKSTTSANGA